MSMHENKEVKVEGMNNLVPSNEKRLVFQFLLFKSYRDSRANTIAANFL